MKKIFGVLLLLCVISCAKHKEEDPLLLPPNFAEMPDPNKPEIASPQASDEDVKRLKELLLESE